MNPFDFRFRVQGATCMGDNMVGLAPSSHTPPAAPLTDAERRQQHQLHRIEAIGKRIRLLEPLEQTRYWIDNEIRLYGKASWHPTYGMTGTIVDIPPMDHLGAGPQVRWDNGQTTWLGSRTPTERI